MTDELVEDSSYVVIGQVGSEFTNCALKSIDKGLNYFDMSIEIVKFYFLARVIVSYPQIRTFIGVLTTVPFMRVADM